METAADETGQAFRGQPHGLRRPVRVGFQIDGISGLSPCFRQQRCRVKYRDTRGLQRGHGARRIAGGQLLGGPEPFWQPPLYPYFLALHAQHSATPLIVQPNAL